MQMGEIWLVNLDPTIGSDADALQIRSVLQERMVKKLGVLSPVQVAKIVQAVMNVLQR